LAALPLAISRGGTAPRFTGSQPFGRGRQFYSGAAGFGKPNSDGLFGRAGPVFAFANVVHFFPDEFASLS